MDHGGPQWTLGKGGKWFSQELLVEETGDRAHGHGSALRKPGTTGTQETRSRLCARVHVPVRVSQVSYPGMAVRCAHPLPETWLVQMSLWLCPLCPNLLHDHNHRRLVRPLYK